MDMRASPTLFGRMGRSTREGRRRTDLVSEATRYQRYNPGKRRCELTTEAEKDDVEPAKQSHRPFSRFLSTTSTGSSWIAASKALPFVSHRGAGNDRDRDAPQQPRIPRSLIRTHVASSVDLRESRLGRCYSLSPRTRTRVLEGFKSVFTRRRVTSGELKLTSHHMRSRYERSTLMIR